MTYALKCKVDAGRREGERRGGRVLSNQEFDEVLERTMRKATRIGYPMDDFDLLLADEVKNFIFRAGFNRVAKEFIRIIRQDAEDQALVLAVERGA